MHSVYFDKARKGEHKWPAPIILATQEAEIRRIAANSWRDPIFKIPSTKQDWLSGLCGRATAQQGLEFKPCIDQKKKKKKVGKLHI
jgi:hypothetical protein